MGKTVSRKRSIKKNGLRSNKPLPGSTKGRERKFSDRNWTNMQDSRNAQLPPSDRD
jgi:hypothetical protein